MEIMDIDKKMCCIDHLGPMCHKVRNFDYLGSFLNATDYILSAVVWTQTVQHEKTVYFSAMTTPL